MAMLGESSLGVCVHRHCMVASILHQIMFAAIQQWQAAKPSPLLNLGKKVRLRFLSLRFGSGLASILTVERASNQLRMESTSNQLRAHQLLYVDYSCAVTWC